MQRCISLGILVCTPQPSGIHIEFLCKARGLCLQVMDMPLLFETGAYMLTWPRVLVAADPATQV